MDDVKDHMDRHTAALVWATPGADELVEYIARVSNPKNQNAEITAGRLIRYLIDNRHWSPFEMVNVCIEINTTRAIGRQLMRHSPRIQEFSQRYASVSGLDEPYYSVARGQHPTNRQASVEEVPRELLEDWQEVQKHIDTISRNMYSDMLEKGLAKELARNILPEGMTPTRMYMNASLRDWLFLWKARSYEGAQLEAQKIAEEVRMVLQQVAPVSMRAFEEWAAENP